MSIFEDTNPRELKELLGQIYSREMALPDFQRDFVWEPGATQELIISIASNYPAGSLLRIRNTHDLFAAREFQGAPKLDGHKPTYLVLDGQQRLTSLYQAFYGVGEHRYYLDLKGLMTGKDFEECIFHLRASHRRAKALEQEETQAAELILPLSVLKAGTGGFTKWMLAVARRAPSNQERIELEDRLGELEEQFIRAIDDYRFPVVTLADKTGADAVCTIFETLNRTGVKLSPYELLTARFWPQQVNLRQLWAKTKEFHPIIADFEIDPYYVLQIISLAARETPSCKRSDVLQLERSSVKEWWDKAADGLAECLEILRDDCGVVIPQWLPYNTIVIPLAALLAKRGPVKGAKQGADREKLQRWFWCAVFGQAYENAPNSQAAKDLTELLKWLEGGAEPETVSRLRFDPAMLRDTTPRQRAIYRGVIALILRTGARDFHKVDKLTSNMILDNHVDDHHIFPDAYLKKLGVEEERRRECVLNRTLIDRTTNNRIKDRPPSEYLREIRDELGADKLDMLLNSHLIPAGKDSPLWEAGKEAFEKFLNARQELLWGEIKKATRLQQATPLLTEEES